MATSLAEISLLAHSLVSAEAAVEAAELALKHAKERATQLREVSIPMAMNELGLKKITLDTGEVVEVAQDVTVAVLMENRARAYEWLESNGFGGLLKTAVSIPFGKGELDAAVELSERLMGEGLNPELKRDIHWQTLKAFVKDEVLAKANADFPLELFGAAPIWTTKVKAPKR